MPHVDRARQSTADRLFGRESAIAALVGSFHRISQGQSEVVLLPGRAGMGKTSLVQQLRGPVLNGNGLFLEGKFNQYQQTIPYSAIREALTVFARKLTAEDRLVQRLWIPQLREAVGVSGRLMVDFVPELGPLLGDQPPVDEIAPEEARHRFAAVLRSLLAVVSRPEHPLVLFIDDWQWADAASLELLKLLQLGSSLRYLLLIAPYRDNEVDAAHPFHATVEELRRQAVPVRSVEIHELEPEDVRAWTTHLLEPDVDDPKGLSALIHRQTGGNPFFIQAIFDFLQETGRLYFSPTEGRWKWDRWEATDESRSSSVVALFRTRLSSLDRASQELFARAACLGDRFDIESLASISHRSVDECRRVLSAHAKLVVPVDEHDAATSGAFKFVHDCVQQAAHGLVPTSELPAVHLEIGRRLLDRFGMEHLDTRIFEVADHVNIGRPLIGELTEMVRAVELNVTAARRARSSSAWSAALHFHRAAGRFLEAPAFAEKLWSHHHELAFDLHLEWAESEFLGGDRAQSRALMDRTLTHARNPTERATTFKHLIVQNTLLAHYDEAIAAGFHALSALGITLPVEGYEAARDAEIARTRRNLAGRSVASLANLPIMTHSEMSLAAKILIAMGPPCYRSNQRLWGVIVPKVVNLTLEHGNIPEVSYSHPAFAGLLCWVANDFALAKEFSDLATQLMTHTFRSPADRSVYALMIGSSVRHWFEHLKSGSEDYAEACRVGLHAGNLQYSSYAFGHNMYCRFYQGTPLGDLIRESESALAFSKSRHNQWAASLLEGGIRIFSALSDAGDAPDLVDPAWEASYLETIERHHDVQVSCIYKILRTFALLVLGKPREALAISNEVESVLYTVGTQGLLPWPEHVFSRFLVMTALAPRDDEQSRMEQRSELERGLGQLRLWASHCKENFEHKYKLAAAELARLDRQPGKALVLYEQAISEARAGGFIQWEAIANERAARFWRTTNGPLAHSYLQRAYDCFDRWGAKAKLRAIEAEYLQSLTDSMPAALDPSAVLEQQTRRAILTRLTQDLRSQALQGAAAKMSSRMERQAEELARATESLRTEVAERRIVQEELRAHREQLEARVTERTAALAESERRYSRLIATAREGIWSVDENLRTTFVNARMAELLGCSAEEMLGRPLESFVFEADLGEHEELMARWRHGESAIYERRYRLANGSSMWAITSATPLMSDDGTFQGGFVMVTDISGLKQKESELLKARSIAESAARLRARFLDVAAHELRTPVAAFSLLLDLTHRQLTEKQQPVELSTIVRLRAQAERLSRLVIDLLDVSRLERGALKLQREPTDLEALIVECVEDARLRAPQRQLSFRTPERPVEVSLDRARIHQVLSNLLDNALKHTPAESPIDLALDTPTGHVRVSVKDRGGGVPMDLQGDLFSPFSRGTSDQEGRFGGLGLGLYICRGIVELHGGTIGLRNNEDGLGCTFYFELPAGPRER